MAAVAAVVVVGILVVEAEARTAAVVHSIRRNVGSQYNSVGYSSVCEGQDRFQSCRRLSMMQVVWDESGVSLEMQATRARVAASARAAAAMALMR